MLAYDNLEDEEERSMLREWWSKEVVGGIEGYKN